MVAAQQSVRVHTLDEGMEQDATISMLFPTADALSQTLVAIVPMDNKNSMWRPGTTIEGDVTVSQKPSVFGCARVRLAKHGRSNRRFCKNGR